MRVLVLAAVASPLVAGCCFSPSPVTPITAPPSTTVIAGGGPRLPTDSPTEAIVLAPGFADPMILHGLAGGPRDAASTFGPECRGQLPLQPSARVRLPAGLPLLRIMARGDSDLTLVVRGVTSGVLRCNDDADGLNPVVEGYFEPGDYDIYVGLYSAGAATPYDLGITTSPNLMPTSMLTTSMLGASSAAPSLGATLHSGVLTVASATAIAAAGDVCTYSEVSVSPTELGHDVRWTITCGTTIVYGAGNGGYGRSADPSWPPGTLAFDAETTSVDTDPAFRWTPTEISLQDDETGALGAFRIDFVILGGP